MTFRGEHIFVGLVAAALVLLIARRIIVGLRDGELPLYRTRVSREEGRTRFFVLLALHGIALVVVAVIAADLLLGLGLRDAR